MSFRGRDEMLQNLHKSFGFQAIKVDVLPMKDARMLLTSQRPDLKPEALEVERVCTALGSLPLGLALAATFLERKPKHSLCRKT